MDFTGNIQFRCACCGQIDYVRNLSDYCYSAGSPLCLECEHASIPNDGYENENGATIYYKNIEDITESEWDDIQKKWLKHLQNLCNDGIIPQEVIDDYLKGE